MNETYICKFYRKEAEMRRQVEAEEQARRSEQRRREVEALRKLQERNKAPWAQTPRAMAPAVHTTSLAEIQRFEREKKVVNLFYICYADTYLLLSLLSYYLTGRATASTIDATTIGAAKSNRSGAGGIGNRFVQTIAI